MTSKSKRVHYKEIIKNCKSLHSANILLAALLLRRLKTKKAEEVSQKNTEILCCRTCLGTDHLQPIFGGKADHERTEDLLQATGLDIQKDDGLPQSVCLVCSNIIKDSVTFRDSCKKTEAKLLTWGFIKAQLASADIQPLSDIKREKDDYVDTWDDVNALIESNDNDPGLDVGDSYEAAAYNDGDVDYIEPKADDARQVKAKKKPSKKRTANLPPYKCRICKKCLANASSLRTHLNWHTGQTAYICETCGKRCINRTAFLQHMKGKHGLQRTDKCSYCDYMALNKEQLKIHERRHTGERPYVCAHCGSGFHRRANLVQHLAVHLPAKSVPCPLCPATFKSAKFLATHRSRAHTDRHYTYVCHVCDAVYKKSYNVRKHLLKVHGVPREQQGAVVRVRVRSFGDVY